MDPVSFDLTAAAEAIRNRRISSLELTRFTLERAEQEQRRSNCFIRIEADEALGRARQLDDRLARGDILGPLHGVPLAHKDMFYRRGRVCTMGSGERAHAVASVDSTALLRLDQAGQVMIGTLNMAEFAVGPTGHNAHWGHCRNPWNPDYITGGSSSGSGAAVSARVAFGALGSDTGGSVRLPSGICGVTGLKPTQTRVTRAGMMPLSFSLDQPGPIAQSARDCALIMQVIAGADPADPLAARLTVPPYVEALKVGVDGLRVGRPLALWGSDIHPQVLAGLEGSRRVLEGLGMHFGEVRWPVLPDVDALTNVVLTVEAMTIHEPRIRAFPDLYQPQVRQRLLPGMLYSGKTYLQALNLRAKVLRAVLDEAFANADVLQFPLIPGLVPTIAQTDVGAGTGEEMPRLIQALTRYTRIFNYLGLPVLTLPCGVDEHGLPIACQLIGRPFDEAVLLRVGAAFQSATDWHRRRPPDPAAGVLNPRA
jgi:aspartyl-tRNA(Asn)/glutamyl-tRNA(Gln) amidotransferase subunit A